MSFASNIGAYNLKIMPNLIIIGAQKCGTTSVHNYIAQHKDIFMSKIKEPALFRDYEKVSNYYQAVFKMNFENRDDYQNKVLEGYAGQVYFGESTTHYTAWNLCVLENIAENIFNCTPNAKLIYILI